MSARRADADISVLHPRETSDLFGHREAETALLNAYRGGCIPHAWLIGGAQGIGKATLAYRMARFVLTHGDPLSSAVQRAEDLSVDPNEAVARQVAAGSHGGLLTLERTANDRGGRSEERDRLARLIHRDNSAKHALVIQRALERQQAAMRARCDMARHRIVWIDP